MTIIPTNERKYTPRKWSRIRQLCKGAAIAEANRARARAEKGEPAQWTATEYKIVVDTYPDYEKIQKLLPNRTYIQIKGFVYQYGIATKRHVWTTKEVDTLKRAVKSGLTATEIYDLFPAFSHGQVRAKSNHLKLKWPQSAPIQLGVLVLDDIRNEARRRNLSMIDLDEICDQKLNYWSKASKHINMSKISSALNFLGGELTVKWHEDQPDK